MNQYCHSYEDGEWTKGDKPCLDGMKQHKIMIKAVISSNEQQHRIAISTKKDG